MSAIDDLIADWKMRKASLRCKEVSNALIDLGFTIRQGNGPGHKVVSHQGLKDFAGTDFDCGHDKNGLVKPGYVRTLIRVLDERSSQLEQWGNK